MRGIEGWRERGRERGGDRQRKRSIHYMEKNDTMKATLWLRYLKSMFVTQMIMWA